MVVLILPAHLFGNNGKGIVQLNQDDKTDTQVGIYETKQDTKQIQALRHDHPFTHCLVDSHSFISFNGKICKLL